MFEKDIPRLKMFEKDIPRLKMFEKVTPRHQYRSSPPSHRTTVEEVNNTKYYNVIQITPNCTKPCKTIPNLAKSAKHYQTVPNPATKSI